MEEDTKLPLKRVELSLTKFNEVAIPHHLDLLRQHKANIIKFSGSGCGARVRSEQAAGARAAHRLRVLLGEMDALRRRVRPEDRAGFDRATQRSRDLTLRAVMDYLGMIESGCRELLRPPAPRRTPARESVPKDVTESSGEGDRGPGAAEGDGEGEVRALPGLLQLTVDERELELRSREETLRSWAALQAEVRALHAAWQAVQAAALRQRAPAGAGEGRAGAAAADVGAARGHLRAGERLRAAAGAGAGAALGALCGGPVGLLAGAKLGAAAALVGSLLGYGAARLLRPAPREDD